jgi:hypothetical protein
MYTNQTLVLQKLKNLKSKPKIGLKQSLNAQVVHMYEGFYKKFEHNFSEEQKSKIKLFDNKTLNKIKTILKRFHKINVITF